ncbi:hypothetical protein I2F17_11960 [Acinetobacter sp. B10A]|uniref:dual OB domain-containing protein n=1 Tax=Acinetobacter baretiae TaxID=2605383 RepID=UPI001B3C4E1A|nr:hypothetical protein [Acinetobacter baretiae]MBF7686532.1 hypothetical protein [Acinetobacter baretiae]
MVVTKRFFTPRNNGEQTIIIFANSIKNSGSCVAGKCIKTGKWIRLVNCEKGSALPNYKTRVFNIKKREKWPLKILQKVGFYVSKHVPLENHQPENYTILDRGLFDNYRIFPQDLNYYLDNPTDLWGYGDSINYTDIKEKNIIINQSLYLINVEDLVLYYKEYNGKLRRRAAFMYNGLNYDFSVTDREFDKILNNNKEIQLTRGILCISLGEPFNNHSYKLVASIIL